MAKTKTMRVAVLMLALTLITSCFVSGTFAKYTTSGGAYDTARVAKWGVEIKGYDNSNFSTEYENTEGNITVKSSTVDSLVAPGTEDAEGVTFTIKGTPEVATNISIDMDITSEVFLQADEEYYYPVVFTLTHTYGEGAWSIAGLADEVADVTVKTAEGEDVITGTLTEIKTVFDALNEAMYHLAPGYVFDDEFTLTWAWAFDNSVSADSDDDYDTMLGDIAAGSEVYDYDKDEDGKFIEYTNDGEERTVYYSTDIEYTIDVTITQVG